MAAVCRDDRGLYLGSSAVSIPGIDDPAILEALACREALSLAVDLQLTRIVVASDCMEVIKSFEGVYLGKLSTVIQEIKSRAEGFASVSFVHERRCSNVEAHSLARSSVNREFGRHVRFLGSPDEHCIPKFVSIE
ncbi:hypothetical protein ACQ4PT_021248 [Festuca glaucescens]